MAFYLMFYFIFFLYIFSRNGEFISYLLNKAPFVCKTDKRGSGFSAFNYFHNDSV